MDLSYEEVLNDLEKEKETILKKAREDRLGTDLSRGALMILDKLID